LIRADLVDNDQEVREYCSQITAAMLSTDLGMPDGGGIAGLIGFGLTGMIAAASADGKLCAETAEKLLLYASETHWPMGLASTMALPVHRPADPESIPMANRGLALAAE
jgi:hypothetical protein